MDADDLAAALSELPDVSPLSAAARLRLEHARAIAERLAAGDVRLAGLAGALAGVIDGLLAGRVPFEGIPHLASAAEALRAGAVACAAGRPPEALPLAAARFELESLLPRSSGEPPPSLAGPDVPIGALRRR